MRPPHLRVYLAVCACIRSFSLQFSSLLSSYLTAQPRTVRLENPCSSGSATPPQTFGLLGGLMETDELWQCLLDTGAWLEPRLSPVVTLNNLTAAECCSACIQAQHCATFELSAGRCLQAACLPFFVHLPSQC